MSREAMQQALEALELYQSRMCVQMFDEAITALRQALEEKREPVGYFSVNDYGRWEENEGTYGEPLYTAPPKQWVGLTDEEIDDLSYLSQKIDASNAAWFDRWGFARAIEQALKEKNKW
jgi:hypothetical protein